MNCTALPKHCPACNVTLPADHFYRHGGHKDNLESRCKSCTNERNRNRRLSLNATQTPIATKLPKPAKKLATVNSRSAGTYCYSTANQRNQVPRSASNQLQHSGTG